MAHRGSGYNEKRGPHRFGQTLKKHPRNRRGGEVARLRSLLAALDSVPAEARRSGHGALRGWVKRGLIRLGVAANRRLRRAALRGVLPPFRKSEVGGLWNGWTHKYGPKDSAQAFPWTIPAVTDGCRRVMADAMLAARGGK